MSFLFSTFVLSANYFHLATTTMTASSSNKEEDHNKASSRGSRPMLRPAMTMTPAAAGQQQ
jgi:hypothetical protein